MEERVWVSEGGRRKSISKRQALAKQFANKGASGDMKVAKLLLELIELLDREQLTVGAGSRSKAGEEARHRVFARLDQLRDRMNSAAKMLPPLANEHTSVIGG